jgi:hypothetical protein
LKKFLLLLLVVEDEVVVVQDDVARFHQEIEVVEVDDQQERELCN